jgi:hypothetical protein
MLTVLLVAKDAIPVIMLAVLLARRKTRRQSRPINNDPAIIRGMLSRLYDERGYPRDPQ